MKKRSLIIFLVISSIFSIIYYYYILPGVRQARASWIYSDYLYRTPITYTHNADISSPRRISITINTSALISAGKMQSDCDDTRFTNEAQKKLRYQLISGCNTTTTSYDVEVLTVSNGTNTIYAYYGNNSATSESTDISGITSLSPSGGSPSSGSEESAIIPTLAYALDEGYGTMTQDSTQQNRDGTISGALWRTEDLCVSGKCLYFDGSNDAVTTSGTTSNVRTVSFWVRPMTTSEQYVDLNGSAYIQSSTGTLSATGFTSPTIYINGQVSSTLVANRWQHIVVTTSTGLSASALRLGQISTNYGQMFMDEFQLYTTALTESQVKSLYNSRGSNLTSIQQGAYDQKALSDGLVGYWKMDESSWTNNCSTDSALDSSGNNNNGDSCPNTTGPTTLTTGKFGNASSFDGVDDYVSVPHSSILQVQTGEELTLSTWFRSSDNGELIFKDGAAGSSYELQVAFGCLRAKIQSNYTGIDNVTGTCGLNDNQWRHAAITFNTMSGDFKMYLNGELVASDTQPFTAGSGSGTSGALEFGSFTGTMDEVKIFKKALSQKEIQQLYNWAPGPVGHWKMDEGTWNNNCSTETVFDSSGNNFNANSCPNSTGITNPAIGKIRQSRRFRWS
ncbi:MAG: hypothetical protein KatS3mg087_0961 [Patescibacteria group bacterium]|nr:MAG: hypothetical protein KatS3mg087_0961 [Patescibacteria group bacterium]